MPYLNSSPGGTTEPTLFAGASKASKLDLGMMTPEREATALAWISGLFSGLRDKQNGQQSN
jgi:hypothetical protein